MLTSYLDILTCVYLWTRPMNKLNRNLIEKEDSSALLENFHTNIDWRGSRRFASEKTTSSDSFDK